MFVAALGSVEECTQPLYMTVTHFLQPRLSHSGPEDPPHMLPYHGFPDQINTLR